MTTDELKLLTESAPLVAAKLFDGDKVAAAMVAAVKECEESSKQLSDLIGYAVSCRQKNTREWMRGLRDVVNAIAASRGDPDRVACDTIHGCLYLVRGAGAAEHKEAQP